MSDNDSAVAATEAAPTEQPPSAEPSEDPAQPSGATEAPSTAEDGPRVSPRTKQRRKTLERAASISEKAEAARKRAMEQPREEPGTTTDEGASAGGRFKADTEDAEGSAKSEAIAEPEPEPEAAAGDEPPAEASAQEDSETGAPEPPSGTDTVRIPLPEDHPYRARGITEWEAPKERETEVRGMLNAVAERHQLRQQLEREREQAAVLQARLKASESDLPYKPTPRLEHLLSDIEQNYSPEEAELIKRGLDSLNERTLTSAEMQARQQVIERRQGEEFYTGVHSEAAQRFPEWASRGVLTRYMDSAIRQWGRIVDAENAKRAQQGHRPMGLDQAEFFRWASQKYVADPGVVSTMQARQQSEREAEREKIRAEERSSLEAAERKKLAEAAERHNTLPPATSGVASSGKVSDQVEAAEARDPKTRSERRRAIRERYAGR